jgi:hypothetical protein
MHRINKTLVYFLIFTIISSAFAMKIVTKAYENVYAFEDASGLY